MNNNIFDLRKFVVPEFVFGINARSLAGRYAQNFGAKKVLIVTDKGVQEAGWVEYIQNSLEKRNIDYSIFNKVTPNPRDFEVMEGAKKYEDEDCNIIIAIGGGSPMDCAKGISLVVSNHKAIKEFEGVDKVKFPCPPLICIPTTAGTAADISQFAIISDTKRKVKMAIISKSLVPDVSLIDPETLTSMNSFLTATTGMDALTHAIESYVSNASSHMTEINSIKAIELISQNLIKSIKFPKNLEFRSKMMLGSLYAGMAFSNASLGAVHAVAHSLGGLLDKPHGECNAILLEHVIKFNYNSSKERYAVIAKNLGIEISSLNDNEIKNKLINKIKNLRIKAGITKSLDEFRLSKEDISKISEFAINDACMATNPIIPDKKEVEEILKDAL